MNKIILADIKEAIDLIKESENIFIASHVNPDGDNLGSSLALALALKKANKKVSVLKSDIIPDTFKFLPGIDTISSFDNNCEGIDLFIAVDCGDEERLGDNKCLLVEANNVINIDHHISNTNFGDINIIDSDAAATGELIYYLIKEMGIEIDKDIATNIYSAISTDTGSFKYESVSSNTHRIIADLLDTGIDKADINIKLYENMSLTRMKLFIKAMTTLEILSQGKIVILNITQEMLRETGANMEDSEGIIAFIKKLDTIEVACILKELRENEIKVSLRTKKYADASLICEKFNGGGHKKAAGCTIYNDIDKARELILKSIQEEIEV